MNRMLAITCAAVLLLAIANGMPASTVRLLYNPTDSAPRGWYWLRPDTAFSVGDEVLVVLPAPIAKLAADRHYLPTGVPLLKRVGAHGGQQVCLHDRVIRIDGDAVAIALSHDTTGRPLPLWTQCRSLSSDELFLLNPAKKASFDSRYFGPVVVSSVRGRAIPLWTWEP